MNLRPLFATFFLLFSLTACVTTPKSRTSETAAQLNFPEQNVTIQAYWQTEPAVESEQILRLEVRDAKTRTLIPAPLPISVSVWMKTHSYGLIEPSVTELKDASGQVQTGLYEVRGIYFLASGQWQVRIYLDDQKDPKPMQSFAVDLGQEKLNPIDDPNSPMHRMMNPAGGGMDHSQHMKMMQDAAKAEEEAAKAKTPGK